MSARTAIKAKQSQPYTGIERLETFAVMVPDSTIIEGHSGGDALLRAAAAGHDFEDRTSGYVTSHGRFIPDGREAMMLAYHADQLRRNTSLYKTLSQGALPFDVGSNDSKVRGVGGKNATLPEPPGAIIAGKIGEGERAGNPWNAVWLQEQARKKGLPPDIHNPEGGPVIRSRALQIPDGKGGTFTHDLEWFSKTGKYMKGGTENPTHAIEGYTLSDGSFITRDEARKMFAGADIGPEGRGWRSSGRVKCIDRGAA